MSAQKTSYSTDGTFNFGGISREFLEKKVPRYSILSVPYDLTASYIVGMRHAPRAIIEASTHMELYDEELGCEPYLEGIETLPFMEPTVQGPEEMIRRVKLATAGILASSRIPIILGGEHSITLGEVQAHMEGCPNLSVLQLDAHADLRDTYQDSPFNHACVARRISEICPLVQVGIRSLCLEEAEFLKNGKGAARGRIRTYYASVIAKGVYWDDVITGLTDKVFVSIDVDVLDPTVMPATGAPEPGGLNWYDLIELLKTVAARKTIVGFDLVEFCPMPGNIAPDFLAAKLVYKMVGYINEGLKARR